MKIICPDSYDTIEWNMYTIPQMLISIILDYNTHIIGILLRCTHWQPVGCTRHFGGSPFVFETIDTVVVSRYKLSYACGKAVSHNSALIGLRPFIHKYLV